VELMPERIRLRLEKWSILQASQSASSKLLVEHLQDWKDSLLAKGNTPKHAALVHSRARDLFGQSGFRFWTDLQAAKLQSNLAALREDEVIGKKTKRGISAQTFNFYLQAAKQFCCWMIREGRAHSNPLVHLSGLNVKTDRRHDRRELLPDEFRDLLRTTESQGVMRLKLPADERALLYRVAADTGLRVGELASLTRGSFDLDGETPSVTIQAAYAKNRRQDALPLRADLVERVRPHFAGRMPGVKAFNVPPNYDTADMLRADLGAARIAWIESAPVGQARQVREASDYLCYRDAAGRVADFHSLRHTFISNLAAGGVHPKTAQRMARHSSIGLTMDRYTHLRREDLTDALASLPDYSTEPQAMSKTGTTDATENLSLNLSLKGGKGRNPANRGELKFVFDETPNRPDNPSDLHTFRRNITKPAVGLEPTTCGLQNRCSTN